MEAPPTVVMGSWNSDVNANCLVSPKPWSPSRGPRSFGPEFGTRNGPVPIQNQPASNPMCYAMTFMPPPGVMEPLDPRGEGGALDSVFRRLQKTLIRMIATEFMKGGPPPNNKRPHRPKKPFSKNLCTFCMQNEEDVKYYSSHVLRDAQGRVTCPVLRAYVCPKCGETGDRAHTLHYCPLWKGPSAPLALLLKKGPRDCSGRVRNFRNAKMF